MIDYRENNKWKVYVHIVPKEISGYEWDKYYVGITSKKPSARWQNGTGYKTQKHFWAAICKYGWTNLEHEIIASNLTQEEANVFERTLIEKLDTMNPLKGYNKDSGGIKGKCVSEETKRKISLSHMGEKNPMYGKCMSEENKKKRSQRWRGANNPIHGKTGKNAHHITPVYKIDKETGEIICRYDTIRQAKIDTGARHSNIIKCCKGERKTAGGFKWAYAN